MLDAGFSMLFRTRYAYAYFRQLLDDAAADAVECLLMISATTYAMSHYAIRFRYADFRAAIILRAPLPHAAAAIPRCRRLMHELLPPHAVISILRYDDDAVTPFTPRADTTAFRC